MFVVMVVVCGVYVSFLYLYEIDGMHPGVDGLWERLQVVFI